MLNFISQLKRRYTHIIDNLDDNSIKRAPLQDKLSALQLAESSLHKLELIKQGDDLPLQIAVLGPTQSGKSTLLNMLTQGQNAGVSALAGFTVHAQGFCVGLKSNPCEWVGTFFSGFTKTHSSAELDANNFAQYSLQSCDTNTLKALSPCVLWDTPDFDSVHAHGYHNAVLRTLALADVLILVVSKEKYADKSVWNLLQLISTLNKPTLVCFNKLAPNSSTTIKNSFNQRYAALKLSGSAPKLFSIPFIRNLSDDASDMNPALRSELLEALSSLSSSLDKQLQVRSVYNFLNLHWKPWTGPISAEHLASTQWRELIDSTLQGAGSQYKRDYINNPDNYDAFKRTLAQLLVLLEIPVLAKSLGKARQIIKWPVRKLFNLGSQYAQKSEAKETLQEGVEKIVLNNLCDNAITSLITQVNLQQQENPNLAAWWKNISQQLINQRDPLVKSFDAQIDAYQISFEQQINSAAQELYLNLEKQPATLNSLRAARATADAAAVGLALKTGGIGMNDFLLAPAMLSITSMLTESALGKYIDRIKAKLRVTQFEEVKKQLLEGHLKKSLLAIKSQPSNTPKITEALLIKAEEQLRASRAE
jgi:hypothetical protein